MKYWPYLLLAVVLPTLFVAYIIALGYTPWASAVLALPNETEILLFTVFAGLGAATIGHFFGYKIVEKRNSGSSSNIQHRNGGNPISLKYLLLVLGVVALFLVPFIVNPSGEFGGTDGQGPEAIEESGYEPWIDPLAYQPDALGERLLFSLQVAIGGAIVGLFVGYERAKMSINKEKQVP